MNSLQTIQVDTSTSTAAFNRSLLENISWSKALHDPPRETHASRTADPGEG